MSHNKILLTASSSVILWEEVYLKEVPELSQYYP